jgi:hypothetical protein
MAAMMNAELPSAEVFRVPFRRARRPVAKRARGATGLSRRAGWPVILAIKGRFHT